MRDLAKAKQAERTILLTGANGQVGFELVRSLQCLGRVVALGRDALDLANLDHVRETMRQVGPALVVNAAAHTAVDLAESDVAGAMRLNAQAPAVLAEEAKRLGAALVHYSTDYVFDGTKAHAYVEDDTPAPQNVYGKSKLEGERAIVASGCAHLILRTSWVYGLRGKNFLLTMLRLGAERGQLSIVSDQFGAPTWAESIAVATAAIVAQAVGGQWDEWWEQHAGTYHLTARGRTSWHGFADAIFELAGTATRPVLTAVPSASYKTAARRPQNSSLSNDKLASAFGLRLPDWREALKLCLEQRG
jgi:dTDP-4-dehydrorhamnose reductase